MAIFSQHFGDLGDGQRPLVHAKHDVHLLLVDDEVDVGPHGRWHVEHTFLDREYITEFIERDWKAK